MPLPRRIQRLQRVILETSAVVVQRELSDPRLGFVTLTRVKLAPDLTQATIYWSALGTESDRRKSARALSDATPVVRTFVAKALGTRITPELTFRYDPTLAQAERLEDIFEKLKQERPPEPPAPDAAPADGEPAAEEGDEPADADPADDV